MEFQEVMIIAMGCVSQTPLVCLGALFQIPTIPTPEASNSAPSHSHLPRYEGENHAKMCIATKIKQIQGTRIFIRYQGNIKGYPLGMYNICMYL